MTLQTGAGASMALSAAAPATQDAAGYAALSYTVVSNVEKLGPIGPSFTKTEFTGLDGIKQKLKGSADYGSLSPSIAIDSDDAGQALLKTAGLDETNKLYSARFTLQDGTKFYAQVRVFGWAPDVSGADPVVMVNPPVEICVKPVEVAAA